MDRPADLSSALEALSRSSAIAVVPSPELYRVVGREAAAVLQRVVTQDVSRLAAGRGRLALLLAPKGQFRALMLVLQGNSGVLLVAPAGRGGELASGLARYLAVSQCRLESLPTFAPAVAFLGPRAGEAAASLPDEDATVDVGRESGEGSFSWWPGERAWAGTVWIGHTFCGVPGLLVAAVEPTAAVRLAQMLDRSRLPRADLAALELARINAGEPAWSAELTETVLPPEVGLEGRAISYTKGCYIGQETIARLKTYGHPNRTLVGVRQLEPDPAPPGVPVPLTAVGDDRSRGSLTSWAWHPELGGVGLALVRREVAAPATLLAAGARRFAVVPLPMW